MEGQLRGEPDWIGTEAEKNGSEDPPLQSPGAGCHEKIPQGPFVPQGKLKPDWLGQA
jgi:hypothetical protein